MRRKRDNNEYSGLRAIFESSQIPEKLMPDSIKETLDKYGYKKPRRNISRIVTSCTAVAAAAAVAVGAFKFIGSNELSESEMREYAAQHISTMRFAESYDDVRSYLEKIKSSRVVYEDIAEESAVEAYDYGSSLSQEEKLALPDEYITEGYLTDKHIVYGEESNTDIPAYQDDKSDDTAEAPEYSDTYNQEKDVLEADIVKTDGKTIYYANGLQLNAVDVNDGKFENLRTVQTTFDPNKDGSIGGILQDLYIYDDKLIVISDFTEFYSSNHCRGYDKTGVVICDKDTLEIEDKYIQEGDYVDVRLRADGQLFIVTNDMYATEGGEPIPEYSVGGETKQVACDDILIPTDECETDYYDTCYINIAVLDMDSDTPSTPTDMKSVIGSAYDVYCSYDNLYIAGGYDETAITRFALTGSKVMPRAGTTVKGYINDQFSMSEYNGFFRIATTFYTEDIGGLSGADRNNAVYVMNMELKEVGKITNFGLNEEIKSVNFSGDKAYVVTFRNTDPLFAIDLSDPTAPVVTSELKITGYSGYMQQWTDGQLLGFGQAGDEDGTLDGIKVSMFDNSDPNNLKLLDSVSFTSKDIDVSRDNISDYYLADIGSDAFSERKSLLILPDKNIIGVPYTVYKVRTYFDDGDNYQYEDDDYITAEGYKFYSFENGKFTELGDIRNTVPDNYTGLSRCVMIGDYLYIMSYSKMISIDTNGYNKADEIKYPEYKADTEQAVYDPDLMIEYANGAKYAAYD